jgi:deazaflavin-dependent oxidoreductase (nitroreductase family)
VAEEFEFNRKIIAEFRANGGKVGGSFEGALLLLLHTTGARTGRERITPVMYQAVGDSFAVFASNAGGPRHPQWYHNLLVNPFVSAEIGSEAVDQVARAATGEERRRIWEAQKRSYPGFAGYEQKTTRKTTRQIPVIVLERIR